MTQLRIGVFAAATTLVTFAGAILNRVHAAEAASPETAVAGFLAAGEFGAAADMAAAQPAEARDELLGKVVDAQFQAGNEAAAQSLTSRMQGNRNNIRDKSSEKAREGFTNGGGAYELRTLIQTVIDGPWSQSPDDEVGGRIYPYVSGIKVDANGVLSHELREDRSGELQNLAAKAHRAHLNDDLAKSSSLRIVSLTRLEKELALRIDSGKPAVESMKNLAGLSQIQFVVVDPAQHEILIGGPAEGWKYNQFGLAVGVESHRPTLQLDDLVTVMRTFGPGGEQTFGCSIDPRAENLKAVKEFAANSQSSGSLTPAQVKGWAKHIGELLGNQDISVFGVPGNSRVARVMVEADYRMKLIGIGKLKNGSQIPDYFQLLAKDPSLASGSLDALRWWMTLQCEAVTHSADQNVFEIRGSGVKCLSENQFLTAAGERIATGKAESVNQQFAANFTSRYPELAQHDRVFAELQGIFDLALVAAIIQNQQLDQKCEWDRGVFAMNGEYHPATYETPKQTESVVNHRVYNGKNVVLQVAGGVRADLGALTKESQVSQDPKQLAELNAKAKATDLPANRWWWDAK